MSRHTNESNTPKTPRFGRRPAANPVNTPSHEEPVKSGMKRSTKVALVAAGAGAIGLFMATRDPVCRPNDPTQTGPCRQASSSSSGGRVGYYGGGSSSSSSQTATTRGGFGSTGSSISAHGG